MTATFVIYIDESGDEGFSFERGSPEWFLIAAVITRKANDLETVKLVDEVRSTLDKPAKKPLHFRDLKHEQKLPFISKIASEDLRTITVFVHKPSIKEPEKFQARYRLYFYATRYLLERASWYCRDHKTGKDVGDGSAEIIFSNRAGMSYEQMKEYFQRLKIQTAVSDVRIDWSVIKPDQIKAFSPGKRMGLQIADAVAGGFFYAVQPTQYGYTEARYARMLKPVVYHRRGTYTGYGIKFWPYEVEDLLATEKHLEWVRGAYKK